MPDFKPALPQNYTLANRPGDVRLRYIVIHATELNYAETIVRFQSPHQVSAHVVIRQQDGHRVTMVEPQNVAWHAGNWDINCRSLGIEQEAYVAESTSFSVPMMATLADQILEWSDRFQIPLDRAHILGHDNVVTPTPEAEGRMHQDPGWYFDWAALFAKLGVTPELVSPIVVGQGLRVTARYVNLYQEPTANSAVIGHQDKPFTYRASYGQTFVCVEKVGSWVAINFSGHRAWLNQQDAAGVQRPIYTVGTESVPLYGMTQPDARPIGELKPGEQYVISDELAGLQSTDAAGQLRARQTDDRFYQIWYGHRIGYVKRN